jgi:DNA-binding NtrC family response regulator
LAVDDEPDVRALIEEILSHGAFACRTCASYQEAVDYADSPDTKIDILLTDIIIPPFHGRDLANRLVRMHPGLKVLFMSGYPPKLLRQHSLLPQAGEFLPKPFTPSQMIASLYKVADAAKPWTQATAGIP